MEQIGWNYDNARTDGKNLFILRDKFHADRNIQLKLLDGISQMIDEKHFFCLFFEGTTGPYRFNYPIGISEDELVSELEQYHGRCPASALFSYRLQESGNSSVIMYGVDNEEKIQIQIEGMKKIARLRTKQEISGLSVPEYMEFDRLLDVHKRISSERSDEVVKNMVGKMDEWNIKTAGLLFGEGHYEELCCGLKNQNIGYVNYNPGNVELSVEDALRYTESL